MTRRLLLWAAALLPISFLSGQQDPAHLSRQKSGYLVHRERAIQMNDLAGHIQTVDDARKLVAAIAAEFADTFPPKWTTRTLRRRIALAEYESTTDPAKRIPEQQIADAWNNYVREIGAPDEARVDVHMIHYMRDALYFTSAAFWKDNQTIWTMPNIYAAEPDGTVAEGCRAVEALRLLWNLANEFETFEGVREQVRKGILLSDLRKTSSKMHKEVRVVARLMPVNPVEVAEIRYTRERGEVTMAHTIQRLVSDSLGIEGSN